MYQRNQRAVGLYNKTQLDVGLPEEVVLRWEVKRIAINHLKTENSVIQAKGGDWGFKVILLLLK